MKTAAALLMLLLLAVPFALAAQAPGAIAQCAACHGADGAGNPAMNAPRLAGQSAAYIARQLDAYADGTRRNAVMEPIAKSFSPEQRREAAQHFATMQAPSAGAKAPAGGRARQLATVGDARLRLQACANCHGPDGIGEPPLVPYLAGQQQKYLASALQEWKSGARRSDPSGQMPRIGAQLAAADIDALSQYFASLAPPAPQQLESKGPADASAASASGTAAPAGGTRAPQGVGIEQGSPTTGGSQGPGGAGSANTNNPSGSNGETQGSSPPQR